MTFREKIIFTPKETIHIHIDYTNFSKGRSFIITAIYPVIFNIIINFIILRIAMFVNPIDKSLKICKDIRLNIIYKFIETIYFLIDAFKVVIALVTTTTTFSESLL